MMRLLTDEEAVEAAEKQINSVARAFAGTCASHPGTSIEALSQVLYMVNGPNWIGPSDMSRAKILAKSLGADKPT